MSREKFRAGAKRPSIPVQMSNESTELFGGEKAKKIQDRFDNLENIKPVVVFKSIHIRDVPVELLETFKNIIYTEWESGNLQANQTSIFCSALEQFISNYSNEIKERPEWVKEQESKKKHRNIKR